MQPVGSKSPAGDSPYGAADMAGNVWEWVVDWYSAYPAVRQENPTGPERGDYKVVRGGGWGSSPTSLRAASRSYDFPDSRLDAYGFRCVRAPGE